MKKLLIGTCSALFVLIALMLLGIAAAIFWYQQPGPLDEPAVVLIKPGTGFSAITSQLESQGVVAPAMLFKAVVLAQGQHRLVKAGEYLFEPRISPQAVMDKLIRGASITHAITIPEGKTTREIVALLNADDRLSGDIAVDIPEGTLLPETHHVHRGDTRQSVIERMRSDHAELLDALWENRQPDLPLASKEEAVILASIVEKETGVDGERGKVASVFINRLRKGMKLQSDPTTIFAIELENGPMERPLYRKDWELEHPYNTYFIEGLPPGPICHPGKAALEAVLNPPSTDALYFVATGRGGHYFARTLAEHNQNIARYKQALREQGQ